MRQSIPKSIKLGKQTWKIKVVSTPQMERVLKDLDLFDERQEVHGLCVKPQKAIYLWDELSDLDLVDTLTHEILHAIDYVFGIKIPHKLVYALGTHGGTMIWENFLRPRSRPARPQASRKQAASRRAGESKSRA